MSDSDPSQQNSPGPRRIPLDALGAVRGGYVASKATADHPGANYLRALQASDVATDGSVDWDVLRFVAAVSDGERYGINDGDVLLPLRSTRVTALVARQVPPGVIAVGHWAIVTPDPALVDSEFLTWYLNHPAILASLTTQMQGTNLKFLSLSTLRAFEAELPPLEVQRRIARVHALHRRIATLEQQLATVRKQYVDAATLAALRGPSVSHSNLA